jgi:hypothetical protein
MKSTKRNNGIKISVDNFKIVTLGVLIALMSSVSVSAQMTAEQIDSLVNKAIGTPDNTMGFAIGVV